MREREVPDQGPGLDSVNELSPPPTEPHHDVHSRRFESHRDTAPAVPDSTDVRREVARLRRALSRLWEATNAHTRDDRTYDRLRADRDTLDEALLAVADEVFAAAPAPGVQHDHRTRVPGCFRCDLSADEVSAAAPDEREATPDEAHDIGYTKGHTDGYREAMAALAARPAPVASGADDQAAAVKAVEQYPTLTVTAWNATPEQAEAIFEAAMDAAYAAAGDIALDGVATLVRRTVADAPTAEPEQGPERLCAACGHVEGVHACTFAAIRCAMCGCTAFRPAADDEGGQER